MKRYVTFAYQDTGLSTVSKLPEKALKKLLIDNTIKKV
jgi:hypothetical protein